LPRLGCETKVIVARAFISAIAFGCCVSVSTEPNFSEHHRLHKACAFKSSSAIPIALAKGWRRKLHRPLTALSVLQDRFQFIAAAAIKRYVQRLNNNPRKSLDFKTPAEAFS
jgi:transposase, IS30 family